MIMWWNLLSFLVEAQGNRQSANEPAAATDQMTERHTSLLSMAGCHCSDRNMYLAERIHEKTHIQTVDERETMWWREDDEKATIRIAAVVQLTAAARSSRCLPLLALLLPSLPSCCFPPAPALSSLHAPHFDP